MVVAPPWRGEPFGAALFYIAYFATHGIYLPFFPVFLAGRGLVETQIAIVLAIPLAMRMVFAPATGYAADRMPDKRWALVAFAWAAVAIFGLLYWAGGFVAILAVTLGYAVFWTALVPVIDAVTLSLERNKGHSYGKIRLWGSLAFIVTNVGVGSLLAPDSGELIFWLLLGGGIATGFAALVAPRARATDVSAPHPADNTSASAFRLLTRPAYLTMLLTAALIQATHAMVYGFGTIHWSSIGIPGWQIGSLWAIGVVAEVFVFAVAGRLLGRFGARGLILIGGIASLVRWLVFPLVGDFWLLLPLQALHGLTFGATYLGTVQFISGAIPDRLSARAQSGNATIGAILLAASTLASGPLYAAFGGWGFALMAVLSAAALALYTLALRLEAGRG